MPSKSANLGSTPKNTADNKQVKGSKKLTPQEEELLNKLGKNANKGEKQHNTGKKITVVITSALLAAATLTIPAVIYYTQNKGFTVTIETVADDVDGGQITLKLKKGATLRDITVPDRPGYYFAGFYSDRVLSNELSLDTKVTKDSTIYLYYILINYNFKIESPFADHLEIQDVNGNPLDIHASLHHGDRFVVIASTPPENEQTILQVFGAVKTDETTENGDPIYEIVADNKTADDKEIRIYYDEQIKTFDVWFLNEDGTQISNEQVQYGLGASYQGETPTKDKTPEHQYTFKGWLLVDSENEPILDEFGEEQYFDKDELGNHQIKEDTYLRAQFTESYREYELNLSVFQDDYSKLTITSSRHDGPLTNGDKVEWGDTLTIVYDDDESDGYHCSKFEVNGEAQENNFELTVNGDVSIVYERELNEYTINFYDEGGKQPIHTLKVIHGNAVQIDFDLPTKADDKIHTYRFDKWVDSHGSDMTEKLNNVQLGKNGASLDVYASFVEDDYVKYRITIMGDNVTVTFVSGESHKVNDPIHSGDTLYYGDKIKIEFEASDDAHEIATHTLNGDDFNSGTEHEVQGDVNIVVSEDKYIYTVQFKDYDGTVLETKQVEHGDSVTYTGNKTPTRPSDGTFDYKFSGWEGNLDSITQKTDFTPTFDQTYIEYNLVIPEHVTAKYLSGTSESTEYKHSSHAEVNKDYTNTTINVHKGDKLKISCNPSEGHHASELKLNGKDISFNGEYILDVDAVEGKRLEITYNEELDSITVTFKNYDDTFITSTQVLWGNHAEFNQDKPTRQETNEYFYTFLGWSTQQNSDDLVELDSIEIKQETTFYAVYKQEYREYELTITEENEDNVTVTYVEGTSSGIEKGSEIQSGTMLHYNDQIMVVFKESTGYHKTTFTVGGQAFESGQTYTILGATAIVYQEEINTYDVHFYDYEGKNILQTVQVTHGQKAEYTLQQQPTKPSSVQYDYKFIGWGATIGADVTVDLTNITQETNFYPVFEASLREYQIEVPQHITIKYVSGHSNYEKGKTITYETPIHYGDTITITCNPTEGYDVKTFTVNGSEFDSGREFTFEGKLEIVYFEQIQTFEVIFLDYDSHQLDTVTVNYNTEAKYPKEQDPTREDDATYHYTFIGWGASPEAKDKVDLTHIKERATVYALYEKTYVEYSLTIPKNVVVTFISGNSKHEQQATLTADDKLYYGDTIKLTYTEDEGKEKSKFTVNGKDIENEGTYTLEGEIPNKIVNIVYEQTAKVYTVNFLDDDGETLQTVYVEHGKNAEFTGEQKPSRTATTKFTYIFKGWEGELNNITSDQSFSPTFTEKYIEYELNIPEHVNVKYLSGTSSENLPDNDNHQSHNTVNETYTKQTIKLHVDDKIEITCNPQEGYHKTKLQVNQNDHTPGTTYTIQGATTIDYEQAINEYTVKFHNYNSDETIIEAKVNHGDSVSFNGVQPTRGQTNVYSYTFEGWGATKNATTTTSLEKITSDMDVYAVYTEVYREYKLSINAPDRVTITYVSGTSERTQTEGSYSSPHIAHDTTHITTDSTFHWGDVIKIEYNHSEGHEKSKFTVNGNDFVSGNTHKVEGDINIVYEEVKNKLTVTFYDYDGKKVWDTVTVEYGDDVSYTKQNPTRGQTNEFYYEFDGWSSQKDSYVAANLSNITSETSFYAHYTEKYREYDITIPDQVSVKFVSGSSSDKYESNKTVENGAKLHWNDEIEITYTESDGHHKTSFKVGEQEIENNKYHHTVKGNTTITYTEDVNTYTFNIPDGVTVKENDNNGTEILDGGTVTFGKTYYIVLKALDAGYHIETPLKVSELFFTKGAGEDNTYVLNGESTIALENKGTIENAIEYATAINTYTLTFSENLTVQRYKDGKPGDVVMNGVTSNVSYGEQLIVTWTTPEDKEKPHITAVGLNLTSGQDTESGCVFTVSSLNDLDEISLTYSDQYIEYNLTIPERVTVKYLRGTSSQYKENQPLEDGNKLHLNDVITIECDTTPGYKIETFTVNGEKFESGHEHTVKGDVKIVYNEIRNEFKVTFYDYDGESVLEEVNVEFEGTAKYSHGTPTREGDKEIYYTFKGWSTSKEEYIETDLSNITQDTSFYAHYDQHYHEYSITIPANVTVTFISGTSNLGDGTPITEGQKLHFNDKIKISYKETDGHHKISFKVGEKEIANDYEHTVDGETTITYSEDVNTYTLTIPEGVTVKEVNADGTETQIENNIVSFGKTYHITVETLPEGYHITKNFDVSEMFFTKGAGNSYVLNGESAKALKHESEITDAITYEKQINTYTLTYSDYGVGFQVHKGSENGDLVESGVEGNVSYFDKLYVTWTTPEEKQNPRVTAEGLTLAEGEDSVSGCVFRVNTNLEHNTAISLSYTDEYVEFTLTIQPEMEQYISVLYVSGSSDDKYNSQRQLKSGDKLRYNDVISVSSTLSLPDEPETISTLHVTGAISEDGNYKVQQAVTVDLEVAHKYLDLTLIDGGYRVNGFASGKSSDNVIIPNTFIGKPVIEIKESAFSGKADITQLTIGENITTIGRFSFYKCTGFTELTIPANVVNLGVQAFKDCHNLKLINYNATNANDLTQKDAKVFDYAGWHADSLTVTFGEDVTKIPTYLFYDCEYISQINFNSTNVENVGGQVFYDAGTARDNGIQVIFGENVQTVPAYLFYNGSGHAAKITSVTFGSNITSIGNSAFSGCYGLIELDLTPTKLQSIGSGAFNGCSGLNSVTFPTTLETIGDSAFSSTNLAEIDLTQATSLKTIGSTAFYECESLTEVTIPESVSKLGDRAFARCYGLKTISYNAISAEDLTSSNYGVFESAGKNAESLTLTFGKNVQKLPAYMFKNMTSLTQINFNSINAADLTTKDTFKDAGTSRDGITVTFGDEVRNIPAYLFWTSSSSKITSVILGRSVITIGINAFGECSKLAEIDMQQATSLETIGNYAFYECTALSEIVLPSSVTTIENNAFRNCYGLQSIRIPDGLTEISFSTFYGCSNLNNIILPESINNIGDYAFHGCSSLPEIIIPSAVEHIGARAFSGCSSLTKVTIKSATIYQKISYSDSEQYLVYYANTVIVPKDIVDTYYSRYLENSSNFLRVDMGENYEFRKYEASDFNFTWLEDRSAWQLDGFKSGKSQTALEIPADYMGYNVVAIKDSAFKGTAIESVVMGANIQTIGASAFENCTHLTSTTLTDSQLTTIGEKAFASCTSLTEIDLENATSLQTIGNYAFSQCNLLRISLPSSLTTIGNFAFQLCSAMSEVDMQQATSLEKIGSYAFYACKGLSEIVLPSSVTTIGNSAFRSCYGLKSIEIPNKVSIIQDDLFEDCTELTNVTLNEGITQIGYYAFKNCTNLSTINLPNSLITIVQGAFYGCRSLTEITIPANVETIENSAFSDCYGLTSIVYNATSVKDFSQLNYVFTNAGRDAESLTVTLGENVEKIPAYMFNDSKYITQINFNSINVADLTTMDTFKYAGASKDGITVTFGDQVQKIPTDLFHTSYASDAPNITNVILSSSITSIGDYAFIGCESLIEVNWGQATSLESIGEAAFYGCKNLASVTIPETVTTIGESAFYECNQITTITIPEGVQTIGPAAFGNCIRLKEIIYNATNVQGTHMPFKGTTGSLAEGGITLTIGENVESLPGHIFNKCQNLKQINFNAINLQDLTEYSSIFNESGDNMTVTFGEEVQKIPAYLFYNLSGKNNTSLINVVIGSSVTTIGKYAFANCVYLANVDFSHADSLQTIDDFAFRTCCNSLRQISLPETLQYIGSYAFSTCTQLTEISIPSSVEWIYSNAFASCNITKVIINSETIYKKITESDSCGSLVSNAETVIVPKGIVDEYNSSYIENLDNFVKRLVGENYEFTKAEATDLIYTWLDGEQAWKVDGLKNGKSPSDLTIPDQYMGYDVVEIAASAFEGKTSIKTLSIGENVTTFGENAFAGCTALTELTFGKNISNLATLYLQDKGIFDDTVTLSTLKFTGTLSDWCTGFKNAEMTEFITNIMQSDATGYENLSYWLVMLMSSKTTSEDCTLFIEGQEITGSLVIPEDVTVISAGAFNHCKKITDVTINTNVTEIDYGAFLGSSITHINFQSTTNLQTIATMAFANCTNLTEIEIPRSVTTLGAQAFANCTSATKLTYSTNMIDVCLVSVSESGEIDSSENSPFAGITTIREFDFIGSLTEWFKGVDLSKYGEDMNLACHYYAMSLLDNSSDLLMEAILHPENFKFTINGAAFENEITVPADVVDLCSYALTFIKDVKIINFEEGLKSIGDGAFVFGALQEINLPNSLQVIGASIGWGDDISEIVIPENVTEIGYEAFRSFKGHIEVESTKITKLGEGAFEYAVGLYGITLGEGLTEISKDAFMGSGLIEITLPNSLTTIREYAFNSCELLEITIPANVNSIGSNAFYRCTDLQTITINSIEVFKALKTQTDCGSLLNYATTIIVPKGIADSYQSEYLENSGKFIKIPAGDNYEFRKATEATDFTFAWNEDLEGWEVTGFATDKVMEDVVIPDSYEGYAVKGIAARTFANNTNIKSITIGANISTIGSQAFAGCNKLATVTIKSKEVFIALVDSNSCGKLITNAKKITVPGNIVDDNYSSLLEDGTYWFGQQCDDIYDFWLADSTFNYAWRYDLDGWQIEGFKYRGRPRECVIPDTYLGYKVLAISNSAFEGRDDITSITIGNNVKEINNNAFEGCTNAVFIKISRFSKLETIGARAFYGTNPYEIYIPSSVKSIGYDMFESYYTPTKVTIDSDTIYREIADRDSCGNLLQSAKQVLIPKTIADNYRNNFIYTDTTRTEAAGNYYLFIWGQMEESEFEFIYDTYNGGWELSKAKEDYYGELNIPDEYMGEPVVSIGDYAFYNSDFYYLYIPKTIKSIGDYAFSTPEEYSNLNYVDFEKGSQLKTLGKYAFYKCININSINIFEECANLTTIGDGAFANSNLYNGSQIIFPHNLESIGNNAFANCTNITNIGEIVLPYSLKTIGNYAFMNTDIARIIFANWNNIDECQLRIIGDGAFLNCQYLSYCRMAVNNSDYEDGLDLSVCTKLERIGSYAFAYSNIYGIRIPRNVNYIAAHAFDYCSNLETVFLDGDKLFPYINDLCRGENPNGGGCCGGLFGYATRIFFENFSYNKFNSGKAPYALRDILSYATPDFTSVNGYVGLYITGQFRSIHQFY